MTEIALRLLEWTVPLSIGLVFILFVASGQPAHGIGWCVGIFLFWAFVNGLMLGQMQRAGHDPNAIKEVKVSNLCFQLVIQAALLGFVFILRRDVKRHLSNKRCPHCRRWNVISRVSGGGTYSERNVVEHFDESGGYAGRSEYLYDTGVKRDSWTSLKCKDCGHSWIPKERAFKDR